MSDVWLFLAIGSLFLAIVLVGVFIDQTIAERHRAVRLLESQVTAGGQAPPRVDLREEELKENFGSRVFVPIVTRAGRIARPVDDQRGSGPLAQRGHRAGGSERAGGALVRVRADAPGDPAGGAPVGR